jgi:nitrite reductase/ring-hydroxylating ferredoxin subunit
MNEWIKGPLADPAWIDIGPLDELKEGAAVLRKANGKRFACVRVGDAVHAVDDACPHQGYPLSQGCVSGGVLTCNWHNWKFDLASGECTFGGEAVRRYPSRVEGGRVHLHVVVDREADRARLTKSLSEALVKNDVSRALRDGLRLGEAANGLESAASVMVADGASRVEWGFGHELALFADAWTWGAREVITKEQAFVLGATAIGESVMRLPKRAKAEVALESPLDPRRVVDALGGERREEAEARVRLLTRERGAEATAREALLPFLTRHIWDYGHGAIFVAKALELARLFPDAAEELLASVTVTLGWATADTSLPPFTATREALAAFAPTKITNAGFDRSALETAILDGERKALGATLAALSSGADPTAILYAIAHAASVRLARFDAAWETRIDAEVGVLDITHAVTFAESAIALTDGDPVAAAKLCLLGAGFVGKLRHGDAPSPAPLGVAKHASLLEAARARDVQSACAIARELDAKGRAAAYAQLAPFLALEAAVRPIFFAHTIKNGEALRRLDARDDAKNGASDGAYLEALLRYAVPVRPERAIARTAFVAKKFLEDARPPVTLF